MILHNLLKKTLSLKAEFKNLQNKSTPLKKNCACALTLLSNLLLM